MAPRFPLRTLLLMVLTLLAFAWFYWNTHRPPRRTPVQVQVQGVELLPGGDGGRGGER